MISETATKTPSDPQILDAGHQVIRFTGLGPPSPSSLTNGRESKYLGSNTARDYLWDLEFNFVFLANRLRQGGGWKTGSNALSNRERGGEGITNAGYFLCSFEATNKMKERKGYCPLGIKHI